MDKRFINKYSYLEIDLEHNKFVAEVPFLRSTGLYFHAGNYFIDEQGYHAFGLDNLERYALFRLGFNWRVSISHVEHELARA